MSEAVIQAIGPAIFEWLQSRPVSFWLKYLVESRLLMDTASIFLFLLYTALFIFFIPGFIKLMYITAVRKYYGYSVMYQIIMLTGFLIFFIFMRLPYFQIADLFSNRTNSFNEAASLFLFLNLFKKVRLFILAMFYGAKELGENFNYHLDETHR